MSKILLIHNSDRLYETLKPADSKRPFFYWYADRFASHIGTTNYLYFFLIDPKAEGVELRSRSETLDFDGLHKDFLRFKDWSEGKTPEYKYMDAGIAMTFSELKPKVTLMARSLASGTKEWLQTDFEIVEPHKPFTKRVIKLFEKPYDELYTGKPIKFTDIPELVDLMPELPVSLPYVSIEPDEAGVYHYENWLPMITEKNGAWM